MKYHSPESLNGNVFVFNLQSYFKSGTYANVKHKFSLFRCKILLFSNVYKITCAILWIPGMYVNFALRGFLNVNDRQLAVNEHQCFLCGLWCAMFVNGFPQHSWETGH